MRYIEVIAEVPSADAPRAADVMHGLFESGLWIETPFEQPDLEEDARALQGGTSHIHAYIVADNDEGGIVLRLRDRFAEAALEAEIEMRLVADEDWAEAWKEHFHVERYGERIVVVPSWRTHNPLPGDIILTLDPGMAFGTGQHETTRMCLEALERSVEPGMRVLDVGCGSGILAIAAARLGAADVAAIDIDPVCAKVATANNTINQTTVAVAEGSMGPSWPFDVPAASRYDIIVANIIARAIVGMADHLAGALAPAGRLIVSGVIGDREAEVVAALRAQGAGHQWRPCDGRVALHRGNAIVTRRFFLDDGGLDDDAITITGPLAHRLAKVLRLRRGDDIALFNGDGNDINVRIETISDRRVDVVVTNRVEGPAESRTQVHLYQSISKGERFEWLVEKATELGVASITPLHCARSVVKTAGGGNRIDRWRRIATEAAEQCGRSVVPTIAAPVQFNAALADSKGLLLLPYEEAGELAPGIGSVLTLEIDAVFALGAVSVFIGPEGGFEPVEVDAAISAGAKVVTLGRRILRCETAGLTAATLVMQSLGELG